ncbi:MAG: 5-formyltetrahydrofolate cyclo-ligase [Myxococcales bacterium]|nr:5-formyltetrahydrofolate cyclo-ligase [Myxococcales bacterium]
MTDLADPLREAVAEKARLRVRSTSLPTGEARARAEYACRARLLALPEIREARGVLVCLSFGDELETRPLLDALTRAGKTVYLPRADRHDRMLHAHAWPCETRTLRMGLTQPARSAPQLPDDELAASVDAAVILGIAFDERGVRLGHGSGYVDRFLAAHPIPGVGVCFSEQVVPRLPRAVHDIPMTVVVTDRAEHRPGRGAGELLLERLSLEHAEIDGLLRRALAGDELDREAYASFRERLLRHIGVEERLLFPAVRRASPALTVVPALERLDRLRVEHAALTSLLVPTPDLALARELLSLLQRHNALEEGERGVYEASVRALTEDEARAVLHRARARRPVPTTSYFDGPGTVRTAADALAKARRARRRS